MRREECNWKRHCASREYAECQEGSRFQIVVRTAKKHVTRAPEVTL